MPSKEKKEFEIRLRVKGKDGKIEELNKKTYLEISWYGDKGILNPSDLITSKDAYGTFSYRRSEGEVVCFEKNGKKYKILVKINEIKKGWFKDKITELGGISPVPGSNFIIVEDDKERKEVSTRGWNEKDPNQKIKPTERRWSGYILVGVCFFLLLVIVALYCWQQNKENRLLF